MIYASKRIQRYLAAVLSMLMFASAGESQARSSRHSSRILSHKKNNKIQRGAPKKIVRSLVARKAVGGVHLGRKKTALTASGTRVRLGDVSARRTLRSMGLIKTHSGLKNAPMKIGRVRMRHNKLHAPAPVTNPNPVPPKPNTPITQAPSYLERLRKEGGKIGLVDNAMSFLFTPYRHHTLTDPAEHKTALLGGKSMEFSTLYHESIQSGGHFRDDQGYPDALMLHPYHGGRTDLPQLMVYLRDIQAVEMKQILDEEGRNLIAALCSRYGIHEDEIQFSFAAQNVPYTLGGGDVDLGTGVTSYDTPTRLLLRAQYAGVLEAAKVEALTQTTEKTVSRSYTQAYYIDAGLFGNGVTLQGQPSGGLLENQVQTVHDDGVVNPHTGEQGLILSPNNCAVEGLPVGADGLLKYSRHFLNVVALNKIATAVDGNPPIEHTFTKPIVKVSLTHLLNENESFALQEYMGAVKDAMSRGISEQEATKMYMPRVASFKVVQDMENLFKGSK